MTNILCISNNPDMAGTQRVAIDRCPHTENVLVVGSFDQALSSMDRARVALCVCGKPWLGGLSAFWSAKGVSIERQIPVVVIIPATSAVESDSDLTLKKFSRELGIVARMDTFGSTTCLPWMHLFDVMWALRIRDEAQPYSRDSFERAYQSRRVPDRALLPDTFSCLLNLHPYRDIGLQLLPSRSNGSAAAPR